MAAPGMVVKIAADLIQLKKALAEGTAVITTTTAALGKLTSSFSGDKLVQHAHNVTAAINQVGVSTLTAAEAAKNLSVLERAMAKLALTGKPIPPDMRATATALSEVVAKANPAAAAISNVAAKASLADKATGLFSGTFARLAAAFSVAGLIDRAVGSLISFAKEAFSSAGAILDLSNKTGLSTDTIQRMSFVAVQTSTNMEAFTTASFNLGRILADGSKSVVAGVGQLGLEFAKLKAQSPDKQFELVSQALKGMVDPQERNRIAVLLFGKAAKDILPAIVEGYANIADGATVAGNAQLVALDNASDAFDRFVAKSKTSVTSLLGHIVLMFDGARAAGLAAGDAVRNYFAVFADALKRSTLAGQFQGLASEQQKVADVTKITTAITVDYVAQLKAAKIEILALSVADRAQIASGLQVGATQEALEQRFKLTEGTLKVFTTATQASGKALKDMAAESKKAEAADKAFRDSVDRSHLALFNYIGLMPALTSGYESWIQRGIEANNTLKAGIPMWYDTAAATKAVGMELDTGTFNLNAWILSLKQVPAEIVKVKKTTEDWLFATRDLFDALGALTGSSFIQWLGDVADSMARGAQAGKAMAKALDEHDWAGFVAGAAQAVVALDQATQSSSKAKNAIGGAMTGASAGAAFGPWGIAIGAVAGAIIGLVRHATAGRDAVKEFAASFGGFDALHAKLLALGDAGEQLWINLTQGVGSNNPAQAKAAIDAITAAFAATPAAMAAASYQTRAELQAIADKAKAVYQFMLDSGQYTAQALADAFAKSKDAQIAALDELSAHDKAVADLVKGFSGQAVIDQAAIMVDAIAKIGGAGTLTAAELANVNTVMADAIAKYTALGQIAPQAMIDLYNATLPVESATAKVTAATQALLDKRKSLMDSIANEAPEAVMGAVEQATRDQIAAVDAQIKKVKDAAAKSVAAGKTTVLSYEDLINRGINPATIAATGVGTAVEQAADRAHIAVMAMIADAEDLAAAYHAVPPPGGSSSGGPASGSSVPSSATSSATTSSGGSRSSSSTMTTRGGATVGPVHIHITGAQSPAQAQQTATVVADELVKLLNGNVGGRRTKARKALRVT